MSSADPGVVTSCLFCRIVAGEIPATILYETPAVLAFANIEPAGPTHVLVVPKVHVTDAAHLGPGDATLLSELFGAANEIALAAGLAERGYRLVMNVGDDAGNSVPHLHLHVIGGRQMSWPPG